MSESECILPVLDNAFDAVANVTVRCGRPSILTCVPSYHPATICSEDGTIYDSYMQCLLNRINAYNLIETVGRPEEISCLVPWIDQFINWADGIIPSTVTMYGTGSGDDGHRFAYDGGEDIFEGNSSGLDGASNQWIMPETEIELGVTIEVYNLDLYLYGANPGNFDVYISYAGSVWKLHLEAEATYDPMDVPNELLAQFKVDQQDGPEWLDTNPFGCLLTVQLM